MARRLISHQRSQYLGVVHRHTILGFAAFSHIHCSDGTVDVGPCRRISVHKFKDPFDHLSTIDAVLGRGRTSLQHKVGQGLEGSPIKRMEKIHQVEEHTPKRPDVNAEAIGKVLNQLRGEVYGCAHPLMS